MSDNSLKKEKEYSDIYKKNNAVAKKLDLFSWIILGIGLIISIIFGNAYNSLIISLLIWFSFLILFFIIYALSEIIIILHDIRRKMFKD